ncbi:MAG: acyl-CoA dehydrogenase family protein [Pseudomonadales bacterium]|nr:acyl-CoA dehydrogenase family protein [Pseudomonadales bacterium]MDP6471278.1 acyl-CoA dehydrogenase family protein [Pseudomonadales bacterium]MDP6825533.1 acyl-CoA dehydrogenase family protein [Pseudomonadales bacterium]MDP6971577.1 acyl-CoA dehydrogenase family protein [Pseudomonadales bacterium]
MGSGSVLHSARSFAQEVVTPSAADWEKSRCLPGEILQIAAERGLTGLLVPRAHGGQESSYRESAEAAEALAMADMAVTFCLIVHNNVMLSLASRGSDDQIARFMPGLMSMETPAAFLLTEPGAGSDAAAISTAAVPDGGDWIINGDKAWVTNAVHARLLSVYAQTEPALGWRGIACFLVDAQSAGVAVEPAYDLLGGHALGTAGVRLRDVRVPAANMLAPPGEGFKAAMSGIDFARGIVTAMCCGMLKCALDTAIAYARERQLFGHTLASMQGVQWQLADVATDLHAARLMMLHVMDSLDAGKKATLAASHAKKFATRVALSGIGQCMQNMGANGLKSDAPLGRHLAGAKIAQYLDGATEIQNVVISRELFGDS